MGNDGKYADGNFNVVPGGTAIKLNKDVEFKVVNYSMLFFVNVHLKTRKYYVRKFREYI